MHPELADLCDYAPEGALLALIKPHAVLESMTSLWEKRQREQEVAHEQAGLYFDARDYYRPRPPLRAGPTRAPSAST